MDNADQHCLSLTMKNLIVSQSCRLVKDSKDVINGLRKLIVQSMNSHIYPELQFTKNQDSSSWCESSAKTNTIPYFLFFFVIIFGQISSFRAEPHKTTPGNNTFFGQPMDHMFREEVWSWVTLRAVLSAPMLYFYAWP